MKSIESIQIPTLYGEFNMFAYGSGFPDFPHLMLVSKEIDLNKAVNVRIHSECLTGDLFASMKCECGEQLKYAMKYISVNKGILLYLRQEGRGIGLINKMKAYRLQQAGLNTIEANVALGFHADLRDFTVAIEMLKDYGVKKVNLLTNNPEKIKSFENSGITVMKRLSIEMAPLKENENYLMVKKNEMGHFLRKV